ncbi:MAG TPA: MBL fold metallo-hydrolase [Pyrinomonadaceae bacterium]|nr:MBL fold metallo-hydrolase [Pyrinomonadaceae bacterium]
MSMQLTVLGSGSTGNSLLIKTEKTLVLIDAGMSAREILRRISAVGCSPDRLDGIIVTHEHGDHAGGLRVLLGSVNCPVFISDKTKEAYISSRRNGQNSNEAEKRLKALAGRTVSISSNQPFCIGDVDFEPFSVPHDAADNFGFLARNNGLKFATLMDFGHMTPLIKSSLNACDLLVIESNHSVDMLRACTVYSWELKQRIIGDYGHLSNEALAEWINKDFDGKASHIVLAHLSQKANDPALAHITAKTALDSRHDSARILTKITLSLHNEPTEWFRF